MHKFNDRELATVLAALRYWQREGLMSGGAEQDVATNGGTLDALMDGEVDALCERINCEPADLGPLAVIMDGGVLQAVVSNDNRLRGVRVAVIDYDAEGAEGKALLALPPTVTETVCTALVSRADLAVAVAACARVVERRGGTIPILSNVLLKAEDGGLVVVGTDLDIEVKATVSGAVDSHFESTVPAHKLLDMLKKAKASEMVAFDIKSTTESGYRSETEHVNGGGRKLSAKPYTKTDQSNVLDFDGLRVNLIGLPPADFPTLAVGEWSHTFTMPGAELARAFDKTNFCISTEETRYYLNGVYVHVPLGNESLRFVATDGHRLAQCDVPAPDGAAGIPGVIVPRKTVLEVLRLVSARGAPESVTVKVGGGGRFKDGKPCEDGVTADETRQHKIQFDIGAVRVLSKLIDGTFPDYTRVIPTGNDKRLTIDCAKLAAGIEQVSIISSERGRAVKLGIEASFVRLTVNNPDTGSARTDIACDFDSKGGPLDVGFNSRYLTDILASVESEAAELMLADPGSPMLVRGAGKEDAGVLYVLMPMRV